MDFFFLKIVFTHILNVQTTHKCFFQQPLCYFLFIWYRKHDMFLDCWMTYILMNWWPNCGLTNDFWLVESVLY